MAHKYGQKGTKGAMNGRGSMSGTPVQKAGSMEQHHEHNKDNRLPSDVFAHQGEEYGSADECDEFCQDGNCTED